MLVWKTRLLSLFLAVMISTTLSSAAATIKYKEATYVGQVSIYNINGKKVRKPAGHGTLTFHSGAVYKGQFSKGRFQGLGTLHYKNGGYCAGHFENGKMQGGANCIYSDGGKYVGNMQMSKRHGSGVMTYADGARYHGSWKNGKPHGSGEKRYASGNTYNGHWKNGQRSGEGTLRYASGSSFIGFWKNSKKHGPLEYYNPTKRVRLCTLYNNGQKVKAAPHSGTRGSCYDKARRW